MGGAGRLLWGRISQSGSLPLHRGPRTSIICSRDGPLPRGLLEQSGNVALPAGATGQVLHPFGNLCSLFSRRASLILWVGSGDGSSEMNTHKPHRSTITGSTQYRVDSCFPARVQVGALVLLFVLFFNLLTELHGMWDACSLTRIEHVLPALAMWSPNYWTTGKPRFLIRSPLA